MYPQRELSAFTHETPANTHQHKSETTQVIPPREIHFRPLREGDGIHLWRIARDSKVLDVNSSYAYVLWARDFAQTSTVCEVDGVPAGFVTGYLRPSDPRTLFVWQVAVDAAHRGRGLALRMLEHLFRRAAESGATHLETTISPSNTASQVLFRALARNLGTDITRQDLFPPTLFTADANPGGHEAEDLYTVGGRRS